MLPKYIVGITHRSGGRKRVERGCGEGRGSESSRGSSSSEARAGVSSPYTRSAHVFLQRHKHEGNEAGERASERRKMLRRARERDERSLSRMWVCNGMCSGRGRDRVAGTAVRPRGPSTPHGGRTRERALMGNGTGDVYYMILIHIYPYVALNAACEMSRAETGERDREENERTGENKREK